MLFLFLGSACYPTFMKNSSVFHLFKFNKVENCVDVGGKIFYLKGNSNKKRGALAREYLLLGNHMSEFKKQKKMIIFRDGHDDGHFLLRIEMDSIEIVEKYPLGVYPKYSGFGNGLVPDSTSYTFKKNEQNKSMYVLEWFFYQETISNGFFQRSTMTQHVSAHICDPRQGPCGS